MNGDREIHRVLRHYLQDPDASFAMGSIGAIAEFHRDADEPLVLDDPERLTIATDRGALRIELSDAVTPLAYETLSRRPGRWQHGVVFCLPEALAASRRRATLPEIGPDGGAIRAEDRDAILFDLGLGAPNVDFHIRTGDSELLALLRQAAGRSVLEPGNQAMGAIIAASPHRIASTKLGRAEVYQAIDRVATPSGPHTHVLPKLLKKGRTHSPDIPITNGFLPCLNLFPKNPLVDGNGRRIEFDRASLVAFEKLLERWAVPEYRAEKARAGSAMGRELDPDAYDCPGTELGRTALQVALRQAGQIDQNNSALKSWAKHFDTTPFGIEADHDEV